MVVDLFDNSVFSPTNWHETFENLQLLEQINESALYL